MIKSDYSVLVVDDEESQRLILTGHLKKRGFTAASAPSAIAAIEILKDSVVDVVISDYKMPEMTGLQFLSEVKSINPEINFIIITAFGTVENAVTAMKKGAYDFISKPVNLDELDLLLDRLIERQLLISEVKHLREQLSEKKNLQGVISSSQKMIEILDVASRVSESKASVLICGDSGTGKEVLARAIHSASLRFDKPFIAVNCAALNENLIESELFGHEKGAFTGADKQRKGRFETADGGTLFLDEIGDLPLTTQIKLLRFLQESEFERVGGGGTISVDVRIIAATNRNIGKLIKEEKFREDLFYRLNVVNINIPPLRERKEDIPLLIDYFIKKYVSETNKINPAFS
ncbi:MAG: sigma-54 dependent transcriptional regulator, partial [Ignavibacteriae bacterium]|nr:sigma-54 dependent transcriptional regulator [Ignavibacteriota bacterium]